MLGNHIFHRLIGVRLPRFLWALHRPADAQRGVFLGLVHGLASTEYGRAHGIHHLSDVSRRKDFVRALPVVQYDELKPWIERAGRRKMSGWHDQVVCPKLWHHHQPIQWLPVTGRRNGHYRGQDLLAQYCSGVGPAVPGQHDPQRISALVHEVFTRC